MNERTLTGLLLDEIELTSIDMSHACSVSVERIVELVAEGVLEPAGEDPTDWRFHGASLTKARTAIRLQEDLGVNLAGVALALDLLDEIETLRARLRRAELGGP
jgi:chaperone modulatory protein CbpM